MMNGFARYDQKDDPFLSDLSLQHIYTLNKKSNTWIYSGTEREMQREETLGIYQICTFKKQE